jgi:tetratricopeptide (TPR) repeat protein
MEPMKWLLYISALTLVACGSEQERSAERALRLGSSLYHAGQYAAADSTYAMAPSDARTLYNRGNSNHRRGHWNEAIGHYRDAIAMDSLRRAQSSDYYNLGTTHLTEALHADTSVGTINGTLGKVAVDGTDIATKVSQFVLRDSLQREIMRLESLIDSSLAQAEDNYKAALRRTPEDDDARYNLTYVRRLIAQRVKEGRGEGGKGKDDKQQELSAKAKLIMKRADELVEAFKFREALKVLEDGLKQDPSLQAKKEYMDKLNTVTKAASSK